MPAASVRSRHGARGAGPPTPDAHTFPTRPYDLVKEFVLALVGSPAPDRAGGGLRSPDEPAITIQVWAKAAPADVVATAASELAGHPTSAGYGPPYNSAAEGQKLIGIPLQKLGGRDGPRGLGQRVRASALRRRCSGDTRAHEAPWRQWGPPTSDQQTCWPGTTRRRWETPRR